MWTIKEASFFLLLLLFFFGGGGGGGGQDAFRTMPWPIFCLRNWQRRSSKVYKGCAVPRESRFVYERVGKRASWVTAIVNLTSA